MVGEITSIMSAGVLRKMNIEKYMEFRRQLGERITLWMVMSWMLGLSNIGMIMICLHALKEQKIIIAPLTGEHTFEFEHGSASQYYLKEVASYFVNNMLTYSPETISWQLNAALPLLDPECYQSTKQALKKQMDWVRQKNISSVYYENAVVVDGLTVKINGVLKVIMAGEEISQKNYPVYVYFSNKTGQLLISGFRHEEKAAS